MPDDPAIERQAPRARRFRAVDLLLAGALTLGIVAFAATWFSSRSRAKVLSESLYLASVELAECAFAVRADAATLRDAIEQRPAESTPLAACAPLVGRVQRDARELVGLRLPRDRDGIRGLDSLLTGLSEALFRERADALLSGEVDALDTRIDGLVKSACRLALGEGAVAPGACPSAGRAFETPPLPTPRVVLDEPVEFLLSAKFQAAAEPDGSLRLDCFTVERDSESIGVHLASSKDEGKSFELITGRMGRVGGATNAPLVGLRDGAPSVLLVTSQDANGAVGRSFVARVTRDPPGIDAAVEVPALPEGLEPLKAGTPVWLSDQGKHEVPTLAIGPKDASRAGGALVRLMPDGKLDVTPTPAGTLLAAVVSPRPRVLVFERVAASAGLALYDVPRNAEGWPEPQRVPLPPGDLAMDRAPEIACGVANERWLPFVARHTKKSYLVTIGPKLFGLKFDAPMPDLSRVCGTCPPSLLARSDEELSLMLPIGNRLTKLGVGAPLFVTTERKAKQSVATCQGDLVLVAHLARDQIWVHTTGIRGPGRAAMIVTPNEHGKPTDLRVAASDRKLFLFWRRDQRMKLRVETLASEDGGITWQ